MLKQKQGPDRSWELGVGKGLESLDGILDHCPSVSSLLCPCCSSSPSSLPLRLPVLRGEVLKELKLLRPLRQRRPCWIGSHDGSSPRRCRVCSQILPTFCHLSSKFKKLSFIYADIDECPETTQNIRYTPTFHFYRDGERVDEMFGTGEERLRDRLWLHS
ncbi:hypothetical protein IEQ34_004702 [Dendrobium chrysotoxum]|uniref:Thioredoxin domain-containing protein n=1 Tax=Dendrobium chrysotoxum TaxID=161865 RepID=A0AAV7HI08_DENCH|nr:hypothetical protein IEQ34_004702 [Dendrobium chrysotoxum]